MSEVRIRDLNEWITALSHSEALIELGALALCAMVAWTVATLVCRQVGTLERRSIMFGKRIIDGVLFPALLLILAYAGKAMLTNLVPLAVFKIAIPVLISLLVIRLAVKVMQAAFADSPLIRVLERTISWVAWLAMVLWVSGLLPVML